MHGRPAKWTPDGNIITRAGNLLNHILLGHIFAYNTNMDDSLAFRGAFQINGGSMAEFHELASFNRIPIKVARFANT